MTTLDEHQPADAEVLIQEARTRARRRRLRITAAAVAVAAGTGIGVTVASGGSAKATGPGHSPGAATHPQPARYAAIGMISADPSSGKLPQLCYGATAAVLSPRPSADCHGIPLRGLRITDIPNRVEHDGVYETSGAVRVVGTYHDGTMTVTDKPTPANATPLRFPVPCPAPKGGWTHATFSTDDGPIFDRYAAQHPATFAGFWLGTGNIPVVTVTDNVDAAEQELRSLYPGDFCVAKARYSNRQLMTAFNQISATMSPSPNRFQIYQTGVQPITNTVDVQLVIVDSAVRQYIKENFPVGMIRLMPLLQPITN